MNQLEFRRTLFESNARAADSAVDLSIDPRNSSYQNPGVEFAWKVWKRGMMSHDHQSPATQGEEEATNSEQACSPSNRFRVGVSEMRESGDKRTYFVMLERPDRPVTAALLDTDGILSPYSTGVRENAVAEASEWEAFLNGPPAASATRSPETEIAGLLGRLSAPEQFQSALLTLTGAIQVQLDTSFRRDHRDGVLRGLAAAHEAMGRGINWLRTT